MRQTATKTENRSRQKLNCAVIQLGTILFLAPLGLMGKEANIPSAQPQVQVVKPIVRVLVLSIPDRKLALIEDGITLKIFDVAVGKPSTPSPVGQLTIVNKVTNPTYYHKGEIVKPGKANPLGNRWMGLSKSGYGIHGTNVQSSVGKAASHGCFRMRRHDVEELFAMVRVGDKVEIHPERDEQVAAIFAEPAKIVAPATLTSLAHAMASSPAAAGANSGAN